FKNVPELKAAIMVRHGRRDRQPVRQARELAIIAELVAALPLGATSTAEICFDDVLGMKLDHFMHVGAGTIRQRLYPVLAGSVAKFENGKLYCDFNGAQGRNRTTDTVIFSCMLHLKC